MKVAESEADKKARESAGLGWRCYAIAVCHFGNRRYLRSRDGVLCFGGARPAP